MNIGIVVYPSVRAKKYLEKMLENRIYPSCAIILGKGKEEEKILIKMKTKIYKTKTKSLNSRDVYDILKEQDEEIFIFTGGGIVSKKLLDLKKFLHIHPGITTKYRGSTCFYYSILQDNNIGMTAMFLSEELDCGEVIDTHIYDVPNNINIDDEVDPELRADMLIRVLLHSNLESTEIDMKGEQYFIIHPVLKHIAILKAEKQNEVTE